MMNWEERFARMAERHEALAQSVELLFGLAKQQGETIDKILEAQTRDGEHIRGLARIAEIHERRLTGLEGDAI